jgi:DNA (cytosine-5)-methyltransferase 1
MFDSTTDLATFTRKRGMNRGKPRLWIEGAHLTEAGFKRGDRFRLTFGDRIAIIEKTTNGNRTVSGKGDSPIIDIVGDALAFLGTVERVKITYRPGRGILCLAEGV